MTGANPAPPRRHPDLVAEACLRCEGELPLDRREPGCPRCHREGFPSNTRLAYRPGGTGIRLPYPDEPGLAEGRTPLVEAPELARELGFGRVSLKLEWGNPTGSHKDRMSAQLVAEARHRGVRELVAASSGNAGVSLAAYAAQAGIAAEIVCTPALPAAYRTALRAFGARITPEADSLARWRYLAGRVAQGAFAATNFSLPAVGTNPFGIDGYKTLAPEIVAHGVPDLIVVPTARGDLLSGLSLGLAELGRHLKLVAVEPFPRLARVLAGADYRELFEGRTSLFSIAGPTVTFQAVAALRRTGGTAIPVDDEAARRAARRLGRLGLHAELSAAATLAGLARLAEDGGARDRHAVLVLTGSGFRDPHAADWADDPESGLPPALEAEHSPDGSRGAPREGTVENRG